MKYGLTYIKEENKIVLFIGVGYDWVKYKDYSASSDSIIQHTFAEFNAKLVRNNIDVSDMEIAASGDEYPYEYIMHDHHGHVCRWDKQSERYRIIDDGEIGKLFNIGE